MLQFKRGEATKNAVYIESFNSASGYYDSLAVFYSQSYDNANGRFDVSVTSAPTQYRHWLVFNTAADIAPTASGQYDIEIYRVEAGKEGRWGFVSESWALADGQWATFGESGTPLNSIYSDRAYVSGSNESSITQYVSPDENGTYTTYNG